MRCAVADVVRHRGGEQHVLLQRDGGVGANVVHAQLADVRIVEQHLAAIRVVQAQQQGHQRGFASAGGTDDGGDGAGLGHQFHAVEHRCAVAVGKGHVAVRHALDWLRERLGIVARFHLRLQIEQKESPFQADEQILDLAPHAH